MENNVGKNIFVFIPKKNTTFVFDGKIELLFHNGINMLTLLRCIHKSRLRLQMIKNINDMSYAQSYIFDCFSMASMSLGQRFGDKIP